MTCPCTDPVHHQIEARFAGFSAFWVSGKFSVTCQLGQRKFRSEHRPPPDRAHSGLLTGACGCWPENNQNPKAGYCRPLPFAPRVLSACPRSTFCSGGNGNAAPVPEKRTTGRLMAPIKVLRRGVHLSRATDRERREFSHLLCLVFIGRASPRQGNCTPSR